MTREEKIEILEKEKAYMLAHGGDRQAEALTSAIIALEQEPCEDCISRKEVISVMCSNCPDWKTCKLNCCRRKALENKKKLPSVYPEKIKCEDAISRQAVLSMQYRIDDSTTLSTRDVVNVDDIEDLPSITPQPKTQMVDKSNFDIEQYKMDLQCAYDCGKASVEPKTGHWITQWNPAHQKEYYYCPECREEYSYDGETGIKMNDYNYCPNCGARMVDPQESEV